jgi:hypothetical protein
MDLKEEAQNRGAKMANNGTQALKFAQIAVHLADLKLPQATNKASKRVIGIRLQKQLKMGTSMRLRQVHAKLARGTILFYHLAQELSEECAS